jgi:molybdate transport system substrate-binding protein
VKREVKVRQFASVAIAIFGCNSTFSAEITVASNIGVQQVLERVRQDFEQNGAYHLNIKYDLATALKRRLDNGESFDVAILTRPMIDDLAKQGRVVGTSSVSIAKTGVGVAVKTGTAKPIIGTLGALRGALLASSGIAYRKEGQAGAAAERVFDVLGITEKIKDRIYLDPRPAGGLLALEEGKAPLAFGTLGEIAADGRVDLVGPLPGDLQTYVVFAVGMSSGTKDPVACQAFIAFLRTPEIRREFRNVGMESN